MVILSVISSVYDETSAGVYVAAEAFEPFDGSNIGVRQKCVMGSLLFALFLIDIKKKVIRVHKKYNFSLC